MQNLLICRNRHGTGRLNDPLDIHRRDFLVLDRNHAIRVEALDMATGNSGIDILDLAVGHQLHFLKHTRDRRHSIFNIDDDPLF